MKRRTAELERAETPAQVASLQRQWAEIDAATLEAEQYVAKAARSQPMSTERQYPSLTVLLKSIGDALGQSQAATERRLRAEIAALEARLNLMEKRLDHEKNINAVRADFAQTEARLQQIQSMFEALCDAADPAKLRERSARLRQ